MRPRKVVLHLSRAKRKLIHMYRVMISFGRELLMDHAKSYAESARQQHMPPPGNLLLFPRTEAAGRTGADRVDEGQGRGTAGAS